MSLSKVDRLYSDAVREMVKHCKHWGYDDSNEEVVSNYLQHMRENEATLPDDIIEELEYTNINKNDYYRVFTELTYEVSLTATIDKSDLTSKSIDQCIEELLLSSLNKHSIIRSVKFFKFDDSFKKKVISMPFTGKVYVSYSGLLTLSSNNVYDTTDSTDSFLGGDHDNFSIWFEQHKFKLLEKKDNPTKEANNQINVKTFYLKDMDIILDSSYGD